MCNCAPKNWQFQVAFWGSFLWLASAPIGSFAGKNGLTVVATLFGGFFLGGFIALGSFFASLLVRGKYFQFAGVTNVKTWDWWFHLLMLIMITVFAATAIYLVEVGTPIHTWYLWFAMMAGSFYFNEAAGPVISHLSAEQQRKAREKTA